MYPDIKRLKQRILHNPFQKDPKGIYSAICLGTPVWTSGRAEHFLGPWIVSSSTAKKSRLDKLSAVRIVSVSPSSSSSFRISWNCQEWWRWMWRGSRSLILPQSQHTFLKKPYSWSMDSLRFGFSSQVCERIGNFGLDDFLCFVRSI